MPPLHLRLITSLFLGVAIVGGAAFAANPAYKTVPPVQDLEILNQKVKEFLLNQSTNLPGRVSVSVTPADIKLKLAPCEEIETFFPGGSRAWGRTTVGVRCNARAHWTIYMQGNVSVFGNYLVAAQSLTQGQTITQRDVLYQNGDLTTLPPGIYTNEAQVIGRVTRIPMNAGAIMKQELAALPTVIQQGQTVRLLTSGEGFTITAEGKAQNSATVGQMVRVRVLSGQIVSGTANANGQIDVPF